MDFKKRLKLAGGCAVASAFLGSFLSESLRSLAFTSVIAAAVIFVVCLILIFVLEGKPSKVRIPVFAAVIVAGMIALFSVTTYEIGVRMTFRPHFDEECYDELSDMEGKVEQISVDGISGWRLFATDVPADKPRRRNPRTRVSRSQTNHFRLPGNPRATQDDDARLQRHRRILQ